MTRSRSLTLPSLPLFLLAAAVVAVLAFGITKYFVTNDAGALPALDVQGDSAAARAGALDANKVFAARVDTTVSINATINGEPMNGAGVVVDATNGIIVTASHVIKDYDKAATASQIVVRFKAGDEVLGELKSIDQFNDLAIIQIDPSEVTSGHLVAAPLANSDTVMVGSEVLAIGAPFGYDWTASFGHVSSDGGRVVGSRINALSDIPGAIQFDASINTGNSGGPVFNARGQVIGVSQQIASPSKTSAGVAFAVPSNLIKRAVQLSQRGVAQIPYAETGIRVRDVTPQLARQGSLAVSKGAIVQSAEGPAATAGIAIGQTISFMGEEVKLGDVIVEFAGQKISSSEDFYKVASLIDAEQPVSVVINRRGERIERTIDPSPRQLV
jgi:S1-C subfamily serine protease